MVVEAELDAVCERALCRTEPVACRMRAIFALKGWGGPKAITALANVMLKDASVLVKHEAAYCLGQMGDDMALPYLESALRNENEDPVVRHEAAEALGAIGNATMLPLLDKYSSKAGVQEVFETCQLAARRIRLIATEDDTNVEAAVPTIFKSVDPAPATAESIGECSAVRDLESCLCDQTVDLFERYRAMFALRNIGSEDAVLALCKGMRTNTSSALFRHEVAFVLGQLQNPVSTPTLKQFLEDKSEHEMVRHEAAEALGSIATPECDAALRRFQHDSNDVVRESIAVALDISEYVVDDNKLHYADTVSHSAQPGNSAVVDPERVASENC